MPLWWLANAAFAAEPDQPDWWLGLPVQSVQIVSPGGGVPDESLDPLLRVRQGAPLDPSAVRLDLATLFHAGQFSAVEADVEPWVGFDDQGEPQPAVIVQYRVQPSPRVGSVKVQGADVLGRRKVLDAAAIGLGTTFLPDVDGPRIEQRIEDAYARAGFVNTVVEVDAYASAHTRNGADRLEVWVRVDEGEARTLDKLVIAGDLPVSEHRMRAVARHAGLAEGKPVTEDAISKAQYAVRADLAGPNRRFGTRPGGWIESRVAPAVDHTDAEGWQVVLHVEAGRRLLLDVDGLWPWGGSKARSALQIDERLRLTHGFVDGAPDRLVTWMQRRGFLDATATVDLTTADKTQTLAISVDRGARHHVTPVIGGQLRVNFEGNSAISDADLRVVMQQASDTVLRYGWVTVPEVQAGLAAAKERYHASGYPQAELTLDGLDERPRPSILAIPGIAAIGRAVGVQRPVDVTVRVTVDEGPLTRFAGVEVSGSADGVDLAFANERIKALAGAPYSPQAVADLAQRIVVAHRDAGYLEADARVSQRKEDDGRIRAVIAVTPGPLVLLRSFVVAGAVRTRTPYLRNQIGLPLGEPLTQADVDGVRHDLYDLGIFRTVSTDLIGDGAARDLLVQVTERPRWSFELGGGLSTDQGIRGFGRITRHNVFGLAHRIELFGLVGLDYRSPTLTDWGFDIRDPQWRAAATYTAPHFPLRNQQIVFDVLLREQDQERTWRMARSAIGASIETKFGDQTTLRFGVRSETRRLLDVDVGALLPGEPWYAIVKPDLSVDLPTAWRQQHSLTGLLLYDRRDDPLQPTRGTLFSFNAELSPGIRIAAAASPFQPVWFAKAEARTSSYVPLGATTLHFGGEAARGEAPGPGILPLEDRYRLGGTGSLRGFRRDGVGPRNSVAPLAVDWPEELGPIVDRSNVDNPTRWVSTGGDTLAMATAEWLVPLPVLGLKSYDGYAGALWVEAGNVWLLDGTATSEFQQYKDIFNPPVRWSFGGGLRVVTPVGPLQIDLAINPDAAFATGATRDLLRSAWDEPAFRAHLSLGTLF